MPLSKSDFEYLRILIKQKAGIILEDGKETLVEQRISPLMIQDKIASPEAFVTLLKSNPNHLLHQKFVDVLTTNESFFFRDWYPFEAFRKMVMPDIISKRLKDQKINIWFGASSSGQEPYSIAMLIDQHFPTLANWKINMIGTDLSTEMVRRCKSGRYNQTEVSRGLPAAFLIKYFQKIGGEFVINDAMRAKIDFKQMNLLGNWGPITSDLDVVFLRNVLIYFDLETKRTILKNINNLLKPGGYLFLGAAESTLNLVDCFERVQSEGAMFYKSKK